MHARIGRLLLFALPVVAAACVTAPAPKPAAATSHPLPPPPGGRPADPAATSSSRVRYSVRPLGRVLYDGLCPPLIAPTGDFLAVQQGRPPTWPTLLAQDQAVPPAGTTLAMYRINESDLQPHQPATPMAPRLLLGRSADAAGFLVEAPQDDGSRWIGRIDWVSGELTWLIRSDAVNALASLNSRGDLAYSRRTPGSSGFDLVFRPVEGEESVLSSPAGADRTRTTSYLFPTFGDDPETFAVFAASPDGIDIVLVHVPVPGVPAGSLTVAGRRWLCASSAPITAYQTVVPLQCPLPVPSLAPVDSRASDPALPATGVLPFFHPALARMAVIDLARVQITPLLPGSFAAVPVFDGSSRGQFMQSTQGGVAIAPPEADSAAGSRSVAARGAAVVPGQSIARATTRADRFILVGPVAGSSDYQCELSALYLVKPE